MALADSAELGATPVPIDPTVVTPSFLKSRPMVVSTLVKSVVPKMENMFLLVIHSGPSSAAPTTGIPFAVR